MAKLLGSLMPACWLALLLIVVSTLNCCSADGESGGRPHHHKGGILRRPPRQPLRRHFQPRQHFPRSPKRHRHFRARRVRVRTACQGHRLTLGCHPSYRVHIVAAFYGRASSRICSTVFGRHRSHHRGKGQKKKPRGGGRCWAKGSLAKVRRQCQGRKVCRLRATDRKFGEPRCRGRHLRGYLRVRYACKFHDCPRIVKLQEKLLLLIARYGKLAKVTRNYWRRRHYMRRRFRLRRKLAKLRRRYHFCFKCNRGCTHIHKYSARLKRFAKKLRAMLKKLSAKRKSRNHRVRWHASRWFLKRKLAYLRARQRMLRHRLRRCMRLCHY